MLYSLVILGQVGLTHREPGDGLFGPIGPDLSQPIGQPIDAYSQRVAAGKSRVIQARGAYLCTVLV